MGRSVAGHRSSPQAEWSRRIAQPRESANWRQGRNAKGNPRAKAQLAERVQVDERFEGEPVWQGEVLVFELLDHPSAKRCYAWEVDGHVTAVLGVGPVDSPVKAVRASILADE